MRKLGRITAVLFLLATLFSCNLGSAYKDVNDSPSKKPDVNGTDNTAELVVVKIPAVNLGRTAFTPDTSVYEDYSFVLSGYYDGAETLRVIKEWNNYDSMIGSEFVIKKGSWRFVLTANKVDYIDDDFENPYIIPVLLGESKEAMTIEEPTELAFSLSQIKDCELNGFYNFTLDFPKSDYWTVNASVLDAKTSQVLDYNPTVVMSKEGDSVNIYGALPGGNYKINVKFVYRSPTLDFASPSKYPVFVVVAPDCMTSGHDRVSYSQLNMQIPINYVGLDEYNLPATYPASFSPKEEDSVALPLPTRDGYDFKGWFVATEDEKYRKITTTPVYEDGDVAEELVLYPRWIKSSSTQYSLIAEDGTDNKGITFVISDETIESVRDPKDSYEFCIRNPETWEESRNWFYNEDVTPYDYKYNFPFVEAGTEYEVWININGVSSDVLVITPTTGLGEEYIYCRKPDFTIDENGIVYGENIPTLDNELYEAKKYEFQLWVSGMAEYIDGIYNIETLPDGKCKLDFASILRKHKLYGKDFVFHSYCWFMYNGYRYQMLFGDRIFNCGNEIQNYLSDIEGTVSEAQISYVSANPTDRGVKFEASVLKGTAIIFAVTEKASGIQMVRDWVKEDDWNKCAIVYPFVEAGKEYEFNLKVTQSDYTLYEKDFTVTATGGLGEFKIENADDYDVELTDDKVMQFTGEPEFTENSNVRIARKGVFYELYEADNGDWDWIYNQSSWLDTTNGTLSLLDDSDGIGKWKSAETITARMSGHDYRAIAQTYLVISGYTDNGQTYFKMNDYTTSLGSWGGDKTKVYVLFGNFSEDVIVPEISDLPGDSVTLTITNQDGNSYDWNCNVMIVDYDEIIEEPNSLPAYETGKSTFNYWTNRWGERIKFPYNSAPGKWEEKSLISIDGEPLEYVDFIIPNITATYTATLISDGKEIGKEKFDVKTGKNGIVRKPLSTTIEKEGFIFIGWYLDEEFTEAFNSDRYGDVTVYAKWVEGAELDLNYLCEGDREVIHGTYSNSSELEEINVGDTLYFCIYNPTNEAHYYDDFYFYSNYNGKISNIVSGTITSKETKLVSYTLTEDDLQFIQGIQSGEDIHAYVTHSDDWQRHTLYVNRIVYEKGPRVNVTVYNGDNLLQTIETVPNQQVSVDSISLDGYVIEGLYTDSALSKKWNGSVGAEDISIYAKVIKARTIKKNITESYPSVKIKSYVDGNLCLGDTLYVKVRCTRDVYSETNTSSITIWSDDYNWSDSSGLGYSWNFTNCNKDESILLSKTFIWNDKKDGEFIDYLNDGGNLNFSIYSGDKIAYVIEDIYYAPVCDFVFDYFTVSDNNGMTITHTNASNLKVYQYYIYGSDGQPVCSKTKDISQTFNYKYLKPEQEYTYKIYFGLGDLLAVYEDKFTPSSGEGEFKAEELANVTCDNGDLVSISAVNLPVIEGATTNNVAIDLHSGTGLGGYTNHYDYLGQIQVEYDSTEAKAKSFSITEALNDMGKTPSDYYGKTIWFTLSYNFKLDGEDYGVSLIDYKYFAVYFDDFAKKDYTVWSDSNGRVITTTNNGWGWAESESIFVDTVDLSGYKYLNVELAASNLPDGVTINMNLKSLWNLNNESESYTFVGYNELSSISSSYSIYQTKFGRYSGYYKDNGEVYPVNKSTLGAVQFFARDDSWNLVEGVKLYVKRIYMTNKVAGTVIDLADKNSEITFEQGYEDEEEEIPNRYRSSPNLLLLNAEDSDFSDIYSAGSIVHVISTATSNKDIEQLSFHLVDNSDGWSISSHNFDCFNIKAGVPFTIDFAIIVTQDMPEECKMHLWYHFVDNQNVDLSEPAIITFE